MSITAGAGLRAVALPPTFEGIGFLPGGDSSSANAVSADGTVVVGTARVGDGERAFRWARETGLIDIGTLPDADRATAADLSADGSVIVGFSWNSATGTTSAFRWTSGGMTALGDLPGGDSFSLAQGVSADGLRVVGSSDSQPGFGGLEGFVWTEGGGLMGLGFAEPNDTHSAICGVSADGSILAGVSNRPPAYLQAFRWTEAGGFEPLGVLRDSSLESVANGISPDGRAIVGHDIGATKEFEVLFEAFRWTEAAGMIGLGQLPGGISSSALDATRSGAIVVGTADGGSPTAFIWDEAHGMRAVQQVLIDAGLGDAVAGWHLWECRAISANGSTLVGSGYDPEGRFQAWRATLGCMGDLDGDFDVDQGDLGVLLEDYGCTAGQGNCAGDLDDDGDTDQSDLGALLVAYGGECG